MVRKPSDYRIIPMDRRFPADISNSLIIFSLCKDSGYIDPEFGQTFVCRRDDIGCWKAQSRSSDMVAVDYNAVDGIWFS